MSKMAKNLIVMLIAVVMFFTNAMTPVEAKGRGGRRPEPTPEPTVEEELIIEDEVPAEEEILEEEAPAEEEIVEETEEEVIIEEELPAEEAVVEEEPVLEEVVLEEVTLGETVAPNAGETRAITDAPASSKQLIDNGDGTYTLALSVTGASESSTSTEVTKANVVLVLDTSNSMNSNYTTYNGSRMTRLDAEKHVLTDDNGIIDSLLAQNVAGDSVKSDIIEVAIANFGTRGSTAQSFTTSAAQLKSTINGLTNSQGTNWEEGLMRGKELADSIKASQPNEEVYVIFLTDGEPTTHNNSYNVNTNYATEWGYASDNAREIVSAGYHFYGIFTWGSGNSSHYLSSLVQYAYTGTGNSNSSLDSAYAQYYTDATSTEALISALNQIVHDISSSVGYTNVAIEDGVTALTASNVTSTVSGDVTGFKYYRSGGSYSTTANNGLGEEWADAPAASVNNGVVDWNLGSTVLEDGVTYTITFVVWPSQASLDLVADLNNGLRTYESLTDAEKGSIVINGGVYSLKTNTDYPTVTYSTVTTTTVDGETTTVVSDPLTARITNPEPVGLAGSDMTVSKIWAVDLQSSRLNEILYNADGTSKELTVKLDVYKDGAKYDTVELGWDPEANDGAGAYVWADDAETIWEETFAVAPGVMTTNADMASYSKSTVEFEGKTYYILETGHDYELKENDFKDYHFDLVTEVYHPMLVDGVLKTVKVTKEGTVIKSIEAIDNLSSLEATNTLRGGINLKKAVVDASGNAVDTADEFEFTISLTNESEVFVGDSIPWYSVNGNYYHDADGNYISEEEAKEKFGDAYEQYGNTLSGSATAVSTTLSITAKDEVRIANVPIGTEFTITEAEYAAYTLTAIDHKVQLSDGTENVDGEGTIDLAKRTITADIVPNRENNVTFTNTAKAVFYVYHSSDNTIERIPMDDSRVVNGKFNIANETKSSYLYGGYYQAYGGQVLTDAEIKALSYENGNSGNYAYYAAHPAKGDWAADADTATAYTGAKATAWKKVKAYTATGTAMTPAAGTVYYLKEVPECYLRPYIQLVYDERADNLIKKLFKITAVDDANYTEVGFYSTAGNDSSTKLASTIKITNEYYPSKSVTLTAKKAFEKYSVPRGYLTSINSSFDSQFEMQPYFVTLDGVKVYGVTNRTVNPGNKKYNRDGGIATTDTENRRMYE